MRPANSSLLVVGIVALGVYSSLVSGCTPSSKRHRNLVFTTYTKLGVDVTAVGGTPTEAVFGYKRFEGAVIPVDPKNSSNADAHSVFAGLCTSNDWLDGLTVAQVFATGDAAVNVAKTDSDTQKIKAILNCESKK